jgi:hypothetical protein
MVHCDCKFIFRERELWCERCRTTGSQDLWKDIVERKPRKRKRTTDGNRTYPHMKVRAGFSGPRRDYTPKVDARGDAKPAQPKCWSMTRYGKMRKK